MDDCGKKYDWPLILAYHSVSQDRTDSLAVSTADFQWQMQWLSDRNYRSMTLADYLSHPPSDGKRVVILTFDDGYADNFEQAFPVLQEFGYVATIFLVSDFVDTERLYPWDQSKVRSAIPRTSFQTLSWQQVHEMAASGIEFGSHTCTHPELAKVSPERCVEEITRSRHDLQKALGAEVVSFSYPRGNLNAEVMRSVERAGYRCAVITPPRAGIPLTPYTMRRMGVYHDNKPWIFRFKATRLMRRNYDRWKWLQRRISIARKSLVPAAVSR